MRIVGGTLGGRRFPGPPADTTRPTSERVREALASALDARGVMRGARVLDLFAGTGALAFEALSRGASTAVLVENDARVVRALRESTTLLGLGARVRIESMDLSRDSASVVGRLSKLGVRFDLVFADPPYIDVDHASRLVQALFDASILERNALVVLEHAKKRPPKSLGNLASVAAYEYGDTSLAFLALEDAPADEP